MKNLNGRTPDIQKVGHGKRKNYLFIVFPGNNSRCVGLFIVASEFCENFIERNPDGNGYAYLFADNAPDLIRNGFTAAP